ncbi:unnamed protein product [Nezara viridula]|uniref:Uncharacterized protein n=1 Tax=Nezara viridula TaxID=85310 RepID=A0A9P0HKV1_NEZVI|nr:unnamed protein product [Nezara viridula]
MPIISAIIAFTIHQHDIRSVVDLGAQQARRRPRKPEMRPQRVDDPSEEAPDGPEGVGEDPGPQGPAAGSRQSAAPRPRQEGQQEEEAPAARPHSHHQPGQ